MAGAAVKRHSDPRPRRHAGPGRPRLRRAAARGLPAARRARPGRAPGVPPRADRRRDDGLAPAAGYALNIAFTAPGSTRSAAGRRRRGRVLRAVRRRHDHRVPPPAARRRRTAAPERWAWAGRTPRPVHVLVLVYARHRRSSTSSAARCSPRPRSTSSRSWRTDELGHREASASTTASRSRGWRGCPGGEPAAGRSRPASSCSATPTSTTSSPRAPARPRDRPAADPAPRPRRHRSPDLGLDGSYLVLRQLRQDVEAFHDVHRGRTRDAAGRGPGRRRSCSPPRWSAGGRSGAPLVAGPGTRRPSLADSNDFGYHADDPRGPGLPARLARPAYEPARLARAAAGHRGVAGHQPPAPAAAARPQLRLAGRRRVRRALHRASTRIWPGSTSSSSTPG